VEERRRQSLDLVKKRGFLTLAELASALRISESTARRDLDHWHAQGVLKRVHGGAMFVGDGSELPALEARSGWQVGEKQKIARATVERIRDGDSVLLDGGTTTLEVARLLAGRRLQVVTNSLPIANLFANSRETDLVVLGGYVFPTTGVALGPLTIAMLKDLHVQQAIMSVAGVTASGLYNGNPLLVETQRQMMRSADEVVVVADHTKIGRQSLAFLCELSVIDTLIVDHELSKEHGDMIEEAGVRLILAGRPANGTAKRSRA
jgi:DeoR/GlpR family transcriptional regulator of sugar metabolism